MAFDQIMREIGIEKYLNPESSYRLGLGYNWVNMLKTALFGLLDTGYASLRELEDCVDLEHLYIDRSKFETKANKYT